MYIYIDVRSTAADPVEKYMVACTILSSFKAHCAPMPH